MQGCQTQRDGLFPGGGFTPEVGPGLLLPRGSRGASQVWEGGARGPDPPLGGRPRQGSSMSPRDLSLPGSTCEANTHGQPTFGASCASRGRDAPHRGVAGAGLHRVPRAQDAPQPARTVSAAHLGGASGSAWSAGVGSGLEACPVPSRAANWGLGIPRTLEVGIVRPLVRPPAETLGVASVLPQAPRCAVFENRRAGAAVSARAAVEAGLAVRPSGSSSLPQGSSIICMPTIRPVQPQPSTPL